MLDVFYQLVVIRAPRTYTGGAAEFWVACNVTLATTPCVQLYGTSLCLTPVYGMSHPCSSRERRIAPGPRRLFPKSHILSRSRGTPLRWSEHPNCQRAHKSLNSQLPCQRPIPYAVRTAIRLRARGPPGAVLGPPQSSLGPPWDPLGPCWASPEVDLLGGPGPAWGPPGTCGASSVSKCQAVSRRSCPRL